MILYINLMQAPVPASYILFDRSIKYMDSI